MKQPTTPCGTCPFARATAPGTLGGAHFTVYVGQSIGPFVLNCHKAEGYRYKDTNCLAVAQCAGAAIFRSNIGVADILPDALHALPSDHERVFSSHAEMIAHHTMHSLASVEEFLRQYPPEVFLRRELNDPQAREA